MYNDLAWSYDFVAWTVSLGLWQSWVSSIADEIEYAPVLETGFGPGHLLSQLWKKGLPVFGVDASYRMARLAASKVPALHQNTRIINGYAQFLPFPDRTFGTIAATFPSNYILESATWLEFKRILKPGGVIYWLPAAWITHASLPYRLASWLFRVTRQVPEDRPGEKLEKFEMLDNLGFNVSQEYRSLDKSVVWIVRVTRKPQDC